MKRKTRLLALTLAVLTIVMAFAPGALAVTYAPYKWKSWPIQSADSYSTRYAYAINRFLRCYYCYTDFSEYPSIGTATNILNAYKALINTDGTAKGVFNSSTTKFVKMFQLDNGLGQDGIVGQQTWTAMYNALIMKEFQSGTTDRVFLVCPHDTYTTQIGLNDNQHGFQKSFKYASSGRWLVNRIENGAYNYIYTD